MTTPEPMDEQELAPAETRGGNQLSDITVPDVDLDEIDWFPDEDE